MSEEEKKIRSNYRKVRKRLINLQVVIIVIVLLAALLSGILSALLNKTYYVTYSEKSSIDYGVHLKENDFYEDTYLGKDYAYIASLIDKVQANFNYKLDMQSKDLIEFEYNYRVDAVIQIKDRTTGRVLYAPVFNEIAEKNYSVNDTRVNINQTATVDYDKYNEIANRFINTYDLTNTTSSLVLEMHVNVIGTSDEFQNDKNKNSYVASVSIPLTTQTVDVKITSATPPEEQKILSCTTENIARIFRLIAIVAALAGLVLLIILWIYAYLSRNIDITYDIKVAKLVRNYKSFIQRMRNSFDTEGYQVLVIDTFNEMLEIRDTIQSPILMEENDDKTCTKFFIPTATKLLYLFEIKVEDYDEIYSEKDTETAAEVYYENEDYETEDAVEAFAQAEVEDSAEAAPAEEIPEQRAPISDKKDTEVYRLSVAKTHDCKDTVLKKKQEPKTVYDKTAEPSIFVNDVSPKVKRIKVRVKVTSNKE